MKLNDIFKILTDRPGMLTPNNSISDIYFFISGFLLAKEMNGIMENHEIKFKSEFTGFVASKYECELSQSWEAIILFYEGTHNRAMKMFIELYKEFFEYNT